MGLRTASAKRAFTAPRAPKTIAIPGRRGGYLSGMDTDMRTIPVDVWLEGTNDTDTLNQMRVIAAWLVSDVPRTLIFDDDPFTSYEAVLVGSTDVDRFFEMAEGTLTFLCPDPLSAALTETPVPIRPDAVTLVNAGTAPTRPRFTLPFVGDETYVRLEHPDGRFVQLGEVPHADLPELPAETVLMSDDCSNVAGWSTGLHHMQYQTQTGLVTGTMTSNGTMFIPSGFGSYGAWHGPTLRKGFAAVQDFDVRVAIKNDNTASPWARKNNESVTLSSTTPVALANPSKNGALNANVTVNIGSKYYSAKKDYEVYSSGGGTYLRRRVGTKITSGAAVNVCYDYLVGKLGGVCTVVSDANGVEIMRVHVSDGSPTAGNMHVFGTVGSAQEHVLIDHAGYNDFSGFVQLKRIGDVYKVGIWRTYTDKRGVARTTDEAAWRQTLPGHSVLAGMVDVNTSSYGSYSATSMGVAHVKVSQINSIAPHVTPIIMHAGDVVEIDCGESAIRVGGKPYMGPMTFDSRFFDIAPGSTTLRLRLGNPASVTFDDGGTLDDGVTPNFDSNADASAFIRTRWL